MFVAEGDRRRFFTHLSPNSLQDVSGSQTKHEQVNTRSRKEILEATNLLAAE
jgi:hypothetical protein